MAGDTYSLRLTSRLLGALGVALVLSVSAGRAQTESGAAAPGQPAPPQAAKDPLGRDTPRGTVLGFLSAGRRGERELASQYLQTHERGEAADALADRLFAVLEARLPARLTQLSDVPEGARANPLRPDQQIVGAIESRGGMVDVVVVRVALGDGRIWLFSAETLAAIPAVYEEVRLDWGDGLIGRFLTSTRVSHIRAVEWVVVLLGLPLFYVLTVALNRLLTPLFRRLWRRTFGESELFAREVLPAPVRLLLLALAIRWFLSSVSLSLFVRQFWSNAASLILIAAIVWLLILLNGEIEHYARRRTPSSTAAAASLLHLLRRGADIVVLFGGLLATLRLFAVDPTPALAGLGVGGIAVALAAQKTLENVIAGASLVFDQAVRVGDFLRMGEIRGTVDHVGLRSTRIRTLDRTIVSVPNSQIANVSLETISARDKFWFHPMVGLRYETTPSQLREVVDGIRRALEEHQAIDRESVRVRFFQLGAFSLDVDVSAYFFARDWNQFMEIQEQLLFTITEIVSRAGTEIAFPSQTMYVANAAGEEHRAPKARVLATSGQEPKPEAPLDRRP
jgi:MscS family membrane protein